MGEASQPPEMIRDGMVGFWVATTMKYRARVVDRTSSGTVGRGADMARRRLLYFRSEED